MLERGAVLITMLVCSFASHCPGKRITSRVGVSGMARMILLRTPSQNGGTSTVCGIVPRNVGRSENRPTSVLRQVVQQPAAVT